MKSKGFTLIEVMIVVAIIAILAAIAYPSYTRYVQRTRRADAKELAMRIASMQERYYTRKNKYTNSFADLKLPEESENKYYKAEIALGNNDQTYVITMTPQGAQADDQCKKLTLNNTGGKDTVGGLDTNGKCW